jgi:hypothetical protein
MRDQSAEAEAEFSALADGELSVLAEEELSVLADGELSVLAEEELSVFAEPELPEEVDPLSAGSGLSDAAGELDFVSLGVGDGVVGGLLVGVGVGDGVGLVGVTEGEGAFVGFVPDGVGAGVFVVFDGLGVGVGVEEWPGLGLIESGSGALLEPSTEPNTRVAWKSLVHRTGTSRTLRPVRGASTILPSPAYMATWWILVQLLDELKNSRSPGSSEYRSTVRSWVCQYWSRDTRASG